MLAIFSIIAGKQNQEYDLKIAISFYLSLSISILGKINFAMASFSLFYSCVFFMTTHKQKQLHQPARILTKSVRKWNA